MRRSAERKPDLASGGGSLGRSESGVDSAEKHGGSGRGHGGEEPRPGPAVSVDIGPGYRMTVDFGDPSWPEVAMDEPPPIGDGTAPGPEAMLAAAVAGCLVASLRYCMEKARVGFEGARATATPRIARNEAGRLRVQSITVRLSARVDEPANARARRCADIFRDFCTVTESVRAGIPVELDVELEGARQHPSDG